MLEFPRVFIEEYQSRAKFDPLLKQGNLIANVAPSNIQSMVDTIIQTSESAIFPGCILPRPIHNNIIFYLLAKTSRDWRGLKPLVMAFAGPTITSFQGQTTKLNANDPVESLLLEQKFHAVAKIGVPNTCDDFENKKKLALAAVWRLAEIQSSRPYRPTERPATTSDLLERFDHALATHDLNAAEAILEDLRNGRRLDIINLRFLRVNLLARGKRWNDLCASSYFYSLCLTRRPPSISCALIEALYRTELIFYENDTVKMLNVFQSTVLPKSGSLFERVPIGANNIVLKAFALYLETRPTSCRQLESRLKDEAEKPKHAAFNEFWNSLPRMTKENNTKVPSFAELVTIPPPATTERAYAVLATAFEEEDAAQAQLAVYYVESLSLPDRESLLRRGKYATIWRHLREISLSGWTQWLQSLGNPSFTQYQDLARRAVRKWPAQEQLGSESNVKSFLESLSYAVQTEQGHKRLTDCLPILFEWVVMDERFPTDEPVPVYLELLECFALTERISEEALASFSMLFEGVLRCRLSRKDYKRTVDAAIILNDTVNAARAIDWRIDLVEAVVDNQATDQSKREELLWGVLEKFRQLHIPITDWRKDALVRFSRILGVEDDSRLASLSINGETISPISSLGGQHVAVYTLTENAGRRFAEILSGLAPTVKVTINSDYVGSTALKQLARTADIFLIAARTAKHAATEFVMNNRPKEKPVIYPSGKGTSSMLQALEKWICLER